MFQAWHRFLLKREQGRAPQLTKLWANCCEWTFSFVIDKLDVQHAQQRLWTVSAQVPAETLPWVCVCAPQGLRGHQAEGLHFLGHRHVCGWPGRKHHKEPPQSAPRVHAGPGEATRTSCPFRPGIGDRTWRSQLPAFAFQGLHGVKDEVFLSIPAVLGNSGLTDVIHMTLKPEEEKQLVKSAETLWGVQKELTMWRALMWPQVRPERPLITARSLPLSLPVCICC